jgi:hypothetical protein
MLLFQTTIEKSKPMDISVPPLNNIKPLHDWWWSSKVANWIHISRSCSSSSSSSSSTCSFFFFALLEQSMSCPFTHPTLQFTSTIISISNLLFQSLQPTLPTTNKVLCSLCN